VYCIRLFIEEIKVTSVCDITQKRSKWSITIEKNTVRTVLKYNEKIVDIVIEMSLISNVLKTLA
jgi:hypothetical protein